MTVFALLAIPLRYLEMAPAAFHEYRNSHTSLPSKPNCLQRQTTKSRTKTQVRAFVSLKHTIISPLEGEKVIVLGVIARRFL
jgi:hypothetical protein